MNIGIIGINHKLAGLNLREALARACHNLFSSPGVSSSAFVLLSTCNRTEIYFSSDELSETHSEILSSIRSEIDVDFDQKLYSFFGIDCFAHLCRVTAGLDSAIVAETEIQGQVKKAYYSACSTFAIPSALHFLFQKSLRVAKRIRNEHLFSRGMPALEHAIVNTLESTFGLGSKKKVLFIGASVINRKILRFFKSKGFKDITICNRTLEKAVDLAAQEEIHVLPWEELTQWTQYDTIILGTSSPYALIDIEDLKEVSTEKKLIIDLSVPRNATPSLGRMQNIILMNIDQLNRMLKVRKKKLLRHLESAEEYVDEAASRYGSIFINKHQRKAVI